MSVFIGVYQGQGQGTTVFPARDYQQDAYNSFMNINNIHVKEVTFEYPGNINFKIVKFNTSGLKGNYIRFCVLVNENNENHILSDDEKLLKNFSGWKNRLTMFGGNRKKSINRKKSNKKTSKKK